MAMHHHMDIDGRTLQEGIEEGEQPPLVMEAPYKTEVDHGDQRDITEGTATVFKEELNIQLPDGLQVLPLAPFLSAHDRDVVFYNEVFHYLSSGTLPHHVTDTYRKTIKKRATLFFLADGELRYNPRNPKVVVTSHEQQESMLRGAHVDSTGVHYGVRKMYQRIFSQYYWRAIYTDVTSYVRACPQCREEPTDGGGHEGDVFPTVQPTRRNRVWGKVQLRVYGPFPRTLQGNEYLAAVVCCHSQFAVVQALSPHNIEANTASFLLHTFCRMGFATCQAVGVSEDMLTNIQSCYRSLTQSCADTLRVMGGDGGIATGGEDGAPVWGTLEAAVEAVVSKEGLSWDVAVQHHVFRHNTTPPAVGGGATPFAAVYNRDPVVGGEDLLTDGAAMGDHPPATLTRRRLRSATLQCRHCDDSFTSKISFRIHQRKHTEDARRRGAIEGEANCYLTERRLALPKKKKRRLYIDRDVTFRHLGEQRFIRKTEPLSQESEQSLYGSRGAAHHTYLGAVGNNTGDMVHNAGAVLHNASGILNNTGGAVIHHNNNNNGTVMQNTDTVMHNTGLVMQNSVAHNNCGVPQHHSGVVHTTGMEHTTSAGMVHNGVVMHNGAVMQCDADNSTIEVMAGDSCGAEGRVITVAGDDDGLNVLTATTVAAVKNLLVATKDERAARGKYTRYTPEIRDEVAHYALVHGIKDACVQWGAKLSCPLSESTVRNFIKLYKRFSINDQEDMGKYASQHGLDKAAQHFTNKLSFPVRKGQMRKFKKFYQNRLANNETNADQDDIKKFSPNVSATKRSYSNQMKEEIGQYASQCGVHPAVQHFTEKLQFPVKESTVRKFKKQFIEMEVEDIGEGANETVVPRIDTLQSIAAIDGGTNHPIITTTAVNINTSNNFAYQTPYTINMNSGNTNNLSSGVLTQPNIVPFQSGNLINQGMATVNYHQQSNAQPSAIMNQSFNPQPGGNNNFQQSYSFSQPVAMSHPVAMTSNIQPHLTMSSQTQLAHVGQANGIVSQQIIHTNQHNQHQHHHHQQQQQQHQQQHAQHQQQQQQQQQLLTTCYHSITPGGQVFESGSLTNEPLCLLKESQEHQHIQHQNNNNSVVSSPVSSIALVPHQCMAIDEAGSSSQQLAIDNDEDCGKNELLSLDYPDDPDSPPPSDTIKTPRGSSRRTSSISRRGNYASYSPEVRAAIGKYAATHGNLAAVNYFKESLNMDIPESTVRGLKDKYILKKMRGDKEVTCLGFAQRGRPMRLGKYDTIVKDCIQELVRTGEKVSAFLVVATAKQVLMQHDPAQLEENGGGIRLNPTWAKSFLRRTGLNTL